MVGITNEIFTHVATWIIGIIVGVGKALVEEEFSWRYMIGSALVTGGLAASASAALVWIPNLPIVALCGIAAVFASVGKEIIFKVAEKWFYRR